MADLHRLPHRLGDSLPGRVDQRAGRRARDEHPRQVEQQRRVLVAARIQPGQRHQHFAAAQIGVADQVEGGIGRNESVAAEGFQQMRGAAADHAFDLRGLRRARRRGLGQRPRMRELDGIHQIRDRRADRGPVRLGMVARLAQRLAQPLQRRRVAQLGKPGPPQQRPQRRIAQRGAIEFAEMRVAAGIFQQQRIAHVVQRRPVLAGRQCAVGGAGDALKCHEAMIQRCRRTFCTPKPHPAVEKGPIASAPISP